MMMFTNLFVCSVTVLRHACSNFAYCVTYRKVALPSPGAVGRLIRRRPSQQQIRARSEDSEASKCKFPRSQSERVLGTMKRGQRDSEDDGFSVQELAASLGEFDTFEDIQELCLIVLSIKDKI